ncbi:MAG: cysteine desulfurase [Eubacteriaceae bacterium]|nr:cysteine desulfurase [Eubacteriaceae bacterium]
MEIIYLDNSSTTRVADNVVQEMNKFHSEHYGNPSSLHRMGVAAEKSVNKSREIIAGLLSVESECIFFNSGGTEGNNTVIRSVAHKYKRRGNGIILTKIEHPSVLEVCKALEIEGFEIFYLDVDVNGFIDMEQLGSVLNEHTILASIMKVNNETGVIQDLKSIKRLIRSKAPDCILHSDCVQAFGKTDLRPKDEGIDILTLSSHKIHGPKGVGAVYIRKGLKIDPLIIGGGQERNMRSGTENVPGIAGFACAADNFDLASDVKYFKELKEHFMKVIDDGVVDCKLNSGWDEKYVPNIINISFKDIKSEVLLHTLENYGIFVSTGSACTSKKKKNSHVLEAIRVPSAYIEGSIRISFSRYNTLEQVERSAEIIKCEVAKIMKYTRRK